MRSPRALPDVPRLTPILVAIALASPRAAFAADPSALPEIGVSLLRVAASLAVVLALLFALAALFRRARGLSRFAPKAPRLETLDRLDVGSRREIRLVRADGKRLVVGITDARMDLLAELDGDPERTDRAGASVRPLTISS